MISQREVASHAMKIPYFMSKGPRRLQECEVGEGSLIGKSFGRTIGNPTFGGDPNVQLVSLRFLSQEFQEHFANSYMTLKSAETLPDKSWSHPLDTLTHQARA